MKVAARWLAPFLILLVCLALPVRGEEFKLIKQWQLKEPLLGWAFPALVDRSGNIIAAFYKQGILYITPERVSNFAVFGQGPDDLTDYRGICEYRGDPAVVENAGKIKVFSDRQGTYRWKETIWLKHELTFHVVKNALFHADRWFLAGKKNLPQKGKKRSAAFLTIYDHKGGHVKDLLTRATDSSKRVYMMAYYVLGHKDRLLFLAENELKVHIISAKELTVTREVSLQVPPFYKTIPDDFYMFKKYAENPNQFDIDVENWRIGYSRITGAEIDGDDLVLQVRTCTKKMKKFALLFYDLNTFNLKHTQFIDDYLLDVRGGVYYCIKNGNPGLDEGTDETAILCYAREK